MLRPRADVAEAPLVQELAHRALMIGDTVPLRDELLQVHAPPAHHPMHRPIWSLLDELSQCGQLLRRQTRWVALGPGVFEPIRPLLVEAMHPVPQGLPVHAANASGLRPVHPVQHRS